MNMNKKKEFDQKTANAIAQAAFGTTKQTKPETVPEAKPDEPKQPIQPLTSEEQAIVARIHKQDTDWQTITEESLGDFSLMGEPYPLPKEAEEKQRRKEFAFRFIEKTATRIDEVTNWPAPARWWICNASNTPFLAKYCDPVHGAIQVKDQILMFKPWWMHEKYQAAKMEIANNKDAAGDIKNKQGKAMDGKVEWKSGESVRVKDSEVVDEVENLSSEITTEE